ncbi:MAG: hypothetical protein ACRC33_29015 [Gemmataceae bacterium]
MNETLLPKPYPSSAGRMSGSAVGWFSGRLSRWFGSDLTVQSVGRFLRHQVWVWPIVAALVLGGIGWWVHRSVEGAMRERRAADLTALVESSVTAVRVWAGEQRVLARLFADDDRLRQPVLELLALAGGSPSAERRPTQAKAQEAVRGRLAAKLRLTGCVGFFVAGPDGTILAADLDAAVGQRLTGYRKEVLDRAMAGQAVVSRPYRSALLLPDANGEPRANLPTMFAASPVPGEDGRPVAVLGLRIRPEDQFTAILEMNRFGNSGETLAFDRDGLLLTQSRFDEQPGRAQPILPMFPSQAALITCSTRLMLRAAL